jgi:magnesium transporter
VVDVWEVRGETISHKVASVPDAARIASDPSSVVWVQVTPAEMQDLGPLLELHPRAVEEVMTHTEEDGFAPQRTKIERFTHGTLLYLYRSQLNPDRSLKLIDSPVILTPESMISVHHHETLDTDAIIERLQRNPAMLSEGIPALLWSLLDSVVDTHLDTLDALSDAVDDMEDDLFTNTPMRGGDPLESQMLSFTTRKSLVQLRRVAQPMREVVSGLMRHEEDDRPGISPVMQPYLQDVYDHVLRVNDTIEGLRDLITSIYETRLALNDHALNTVTRQLAAWAAIIAVPTAVTGFYGQNIPYPGFGRPLGFLTSTTIWLGLSVLLYVAFRKRRWL